MFYMRLVEDTSKGTYGDFTMFGNDSGIRGFLSLTDKLDVAALLTVLYEAGCIETPLHFTEGIGLSRPDFYLDHVHPRQASRLRLLKIQLQRLLQVSERFLLALALAGDVGFQTLGDKPLSFTPGGCDEWLFDSLF